MHHHMGIAILFRTFRKVQLRPIKFILYYSGIECLGGLHFVMKTSDVPRLRVYDNLSMPFITTFLPNYSSILAGSYRGFLFYLLIIIRNRSRVRVRAIAIMRFGRGSKWLVRSCDSLRAFNIVITITIAITVAITVAITIAITIAIAIAVAIITTISDTIIFTIVVGDTIATKRTAAKKYIYIYMYICRQVHN